MTIKSNDGISSRDRISLRRARRTILSAQHFLILIFACGLSILGFADYSEAVGAAEAVDKTSSCSQDSSLCLTFKKSSSEKSPSLSQTAVALAETSIPLEGVVGHVDPPPSVDLSPTIIQKPAANDLDESLSMLNAVTGMISASSPADGLSGALELANKVDPDFKLLDSKSNELDKTMAVMKTATGMMSASSPADGMSSALSLVSELNGGAENKELQKTASIMKAASTLASAPSDPLGGMMGAYQFAQNFYPEDSATAKGLGKMSEIYNVVKPLSSISGNGGIGDAMSAGQVGLGLYAMMEKENQEAKAEAMKRVTESKRQDLQEKARQQAIEKIKRKEKKAKIQAKRELLSDLHDQVMSRMKLYKKKTPRPPSQSPVRAAGGMTEVFKKLEPVHDILNAGPLGVFTKTENPNLSFKKSENSSRR